jgi:hypothetical protein
MFPFANTVINVVPVVEATVKSGDVAASCPVEETESFEKGVDVPTPTLPLLFTMN